jgi:plastocyanin
LGGATALAGGPTVIATSGDEFFPKTLTIQAGMTVTWENQGLQHNVKFDDGSFDQPPDPSSAPWRVSRKFTLPGVYRYYDEAHGGPHGKGMSGTVVVEAVQTGPRLDRLTVTPRRICTRQVHGCPTTRAVVTFVLSEDAHVAGGVDPVGGRAGRAGADLDLDGKRGTNSIRLSGRRLQPGTYRVTLSAEDENGNESDAAMAYFRVKRARR